MNIAILILIIKFQFEVTWPPCCVNVNLLHSPHLMTNSAAKSIWNTFSYSIYFVFFAIVFLLFCKPEGEAFRVVNYASFYIKL